MPSPDCTDLNQGVPVNLTCKLTRKQQTIKFRSVSAGFANHSYAVYRQGSADTEDDKKIGYDECIIKAIYFRSAMSCRCR